MLIYYSPFNLVAIALLQGCATTLLSQAPVINTETKRSIFARDVIKAIGYPEENGIRVNGLVLLGDNFSYLVTKGQDQIDLIATRKAHSLAVRRIKTIKIRRTA